MKNKIGIIVAYDDKNAIGKDGKIPWNIPGEQSQFKELTTNNIVVMGRTTYEEIGKPLPNRVNVIISSRMYQFKDEYSGLFIYKYISEFLDDYKNSNGLLSKFIGKSVKEFHNKNIYAIGGKNIFTYFLNIVDIVYATQIYGDFNGDVFFPDISNNFKLKEESNLFVSTNDKRSYKYKRYTYVKR